MNASYNLQVKQRHQRFPMYPYKLNCGIMGFSVNLTTESSVKPQKHHACLRFLTSLLAKYGSKYSFKAVEYRFLTIVQ